MQFWKMSGAGNDFIMIDNRTGQFNTALTTDRIASICRRGLSIGADGLIELRESTENAFRMKYYNSDGGAADMCGNGARCICRFSTLLGITEPGREFSFESDAGKHRGLVTGHAEARIWMTDPELHYTEGNVTAEGKVLTVGYADTGVPHVVVFAEDIDDGSFEKYAPVLRVHPSFPGGTNASWIRIEPDGSLVMRTFERGVEGETLACGTGAVAAALISSKRFESVNLPVSILVRSGLTLTVGHDPAGWWLQGEARIVYRGETLS